MHWHKFDVGVINTCSLHDQSYSADIRKIAFENTSGLLRGDDKSLQYLIRQLQYVTAKVLFRDYTRKALGVWVYRQPRHEAVIFPKDWRANPSCDDLAKDTFTILGDWFIVPHQADYTRRAPYNSHMSRFALLDKPAYYADLIASLAKAQSGDRVILCTMTHVPRHPDVAPLYAAIAAAARRGANVRLLTDAYDYLINDSPLLPGPLLFHPELPHTKLAKPFQDRREAIAELEQAGVHHVLINHPHRGFTNPKAGRSHMKFAVIGDQFYVGGSNFDAFDRLDLMVTAHNRGIADWLEGLATAVERTGQTTTALSGDRTHSEGLSTKLLVDAGLPRKSCIMNRAYEWIDTAKEWIVYSSQYLPYGTMAQRLLGAHRRGVKVDIYYNHPSLMFWQERWGHYGLQALERRRLPASFFAHAHRGPGYLHAKVLATERGAIVGSHNFISAGVNLGTAELALAVQDPEFAKDAVEAIKRLVAPAPAQSR
jgi:cardiolipin synthase